MTPTLDSAVAANHRRLEIRICTVDDIPVLGSRRRLDERHDIAIFRTSDDAVFALHDQCPHKGGPLSQGIVHGRSVTCPLHGWKIGLDTGEAAAPDVGCTRRFAVKVDAGDVYLSI
jgi:nitrite reductase (NADH) small subunit